MHGRLSYVFALQIHTMRVSGEHITVLLKNQGLYEHPLHDFYQGDTVDIGLRSRNTQSKTSLQITYVIKQSVHYIYLKF